MTTETLKQSNISYVNERLDMKIKPTNKSITHLQFSQIWEKLSEKQKKLIAFKDAPTTDVILNDLPRAFDKLIEALKETDTELVVTEEEAYKIKDGGDYDTRIKKEWKTIKTETTGAEDHYAYFTGIYKQKKTGKFYELDWTTISGSPEFDDIENGMVTMHELVPQEKIIIEYIRK